MDRTFGKALFWGILSTAFFSFTFLFNRTINLGGGYWMWSCCLRYIMTLPMMWLIVMWVGRWQPQIMKKGAGTSQRPVGQVLDAIKDRPIQWLVWSTVAFGMFYAPLTMASIFGESWFISATWQITLVCGVFLAPVFGNKIPVKNLGCAMIVLFGIFLLQLGHIHSITTSGLMATILLIVIGAVSYPLGNRKMMIYCPDSLTTNQRILGMTICSMPFWLILSAYALFSHGWPSVDQSIQSFIVALFSGVVATILFFGATNLVKHNHRQLVVIEACQSFETVFTLIFGVIFVGDPMPSAAGFAGIGIIVVGMMINSIVSAGK